jgi:sortase (surface protein transpeptidase)
MSIKLKSFTTQSRLAILLIIFGLVLGLLAIWFSVHDRSTQPKPPLGALTSKSAPSSVKLSTKAIASYTVPPTDPRYITIPAIGIRNTPVLKLGLLASGAIAVPDSIYETGWYDGSAKPGQSGAMFIYGHVSSWTANGIFYNLKKLVPGNQVTITRGDNTTYTYKVESIKIYPYNNVDMNQALAPIDPKQPGLNLMTCTGQVIKGTSEFNERLVVFTSLVSS